jgi:hypothetical protein
MNKMKSLKGSLALLLAVLVNLYFVPFIFAAPLSTISDTMTRIQVSATSDHTIKFTTPSGIDSGDTITLTFPGSSFTMGASLSGVTIADGAGADNTVTSATWSAPTLTITASATSLVADGNVATIKIPNAQITNPGTANTYVVSVAGTFGDTGSFAIAISEYDHVVLSANVDPSITFSLSTNASAFGALSTGSVTTASPNITLTVATNAGAGYSITVRDLGNGTNGGLYNSGVNYLIQSTSATLAAGTEGYGIQATSATATVAAPYNVSGNVVGALSTTPQSLATYSTNTTANHTVAVTHKAAISGSTKAGSFSDTLTYIATGNF